MPGNESAVIKYLFRNKNRLELPHLGLIKSIGFPNGLTNNYKEIKNENEILECCSDNARKKADVYINGQGVSIKQSGGSFSFNRLQRAELIEVFASLIFDAPHNVLTQLDKEVEKFHFGKLSGRGRPWKDFFSNKEFYALTNALMMLQSPNYGLSLHPAKFILEASKNLTTNPSLKVYTFDEYFERYNEFFRIAIRRVWLGQNSKSEHGRAKSLIAKPENATWVFNTISGTPRSGWKVDFPKSERRTVYYLMIEKVNSK